MAEYTGTLISPGSDGTVLEVVVLHVPGGENDYHLEYPDDLREFVRQAIIAGTQVIVTGEVVGSSGRYLPTLRVSAIREEKQNALS